MPWSFLRQKCRRILNKPVSALGLQDRPALPGAAAGARTAPSLSWLRGSLGCWTHCTSVNVASRRGPVGDEFMQGLRRWQMLYFRLLGLAHNQTVHKNKWHLCSTSTASKLHTHHGKLLQASTPGSLGTKPNATEDVTSPNRQKGGGGMKEQHLPLLAARRLGVGEHSCRQQTQGQSWGCHGPAR